MANYIEITPLNSPYTLDFSSNVGTANVATDQIFIKSKGAPNTLILGALANVSGLPKITIVTEDASLAIYTTGTDCAVTPATGGVGVSGISGLVLTTTANSGNEIENFISPAKKYWVIK